MARKFFRENLPEKLAAIEASQPPSKAARSVGKALGRFAGRFFK